jgi:hypothetical protein
MLLHAFGAFAGKYSITHFDRSNGFPGNKIYYAFQDSRNYIWMGTENGLVSYNGYEFKTYTMSEGLPDNDVFRINEDALGRLWIITFSNELCYMWKGEIFNARNSALIRSLKVKGFPQSLETDRDKNIWIGEIGTLTRMDTNGTVRKYTHLDKDRITEDLALMPDSSGRILLLKGRKIFRYNSGNFDLVVELPPRSGYQYHRNNYLKAILCEYSWTPFPLFIKSYKSNKSNFYQKKDWDNLNFFLKLSPDKVGMGTAKGFFIKDFPGGRTVEHLLAGEKTSWCLVSRDSSLWIGTLGSGIFHCVRSLAGTVPTEKEHAVLSLGSFNGFLYYATDASTLNQVGFNEKNEPVTLKERIIDKDHQWEFCTYMGQDSRKNWIIAMFGEISKYTFPGGKPVQRYRIGACKHTFNEDPQHLLLATSTGIFRLDKELFTKPVKLYNGRVTSIVKLKDTIYAGTLQGLLAIYPGTGTHTYLSLPPLISRHVTALGLQGDSILWAAGNNATLIGICNRRVIAVIDKKNGIVCKRISAIKVSDHKLWVGTDNGLFVLSSSPPYQVLRHLSNANGLNDNQVNCIDSALGRMWIGTDRGLNYFDDREHAPFKTPPIFFVTQIKSNGRTIEQTDGILRVKGKTLTIHFDVVDHSGNSRPSFSYFQDNSSWQELENSNLYFPEMPYGHSTLILRAQSPFWPAPEFIKLSFYRAYPFYFQWWFMSLGGLLILFFCYSLFQIFLRYARKKDKEKLLVQKNLLQLEQLALQGQMNPHFIFNCITAISQYYNEGDLKKADDFVVNFSTLIRTTFEMVNQTFTTLEDELKYLHQYLMVECERFGNSFDFSVQTKVVDPPSVIPVPAMLLQPLVENAVRHGIRHLPDGTGKVEVSVAQQEELICITIADNGIGRTKSKTFRQAYGGAAATTSTRVNEKRIDILNQLFDHKISMNITDVLTDTGEIAGTRVLIIYSKLIYDLKPKLYSPDN